MNLELEVAWPKGGPLARAYFSGRPEAEAFYRHPFLHPNAVPERAAVLDEWFQEERRRVAAEVLSASNPTEADRIAAWRRASGLVVTTGQQPGLLTGPLLAVNKALSAVALAERWSSSLGRPVLPVFWIASEDHDWEESYHAYLLSHENQPTRLEAIPQAPPAGRPLFRVPLEGPEALVAQIQELLPPNDFRDQCLAALEEAYPEGSTLPDGCEQLLRTWLGPLGLLIVRADAPELKRASSKVLATELKQGADFERGLEERALAIAAAGFDVQVPVLPGALNLFGEGEGGRERLYRDGGSVKFHTSGQTSNIAALDNRFCEDPSLLSPNVLLRPVVECAVFPVLAYLAGPGEAQYFAQLQPLFEAHGVPMPIVHPRISITVIEPKIRKVLDKVPVTIPELAQPAHEWASERARDEMPEAARAVLGALRGEIGGGTSQLLAAVRHIDPTLKGPIGHARNAALQALSEAEKKILKGIKRQQEIVLGQVDKARNNLMPLGKPQERVLAPLQFAGRYGTEFFSFLLEGCRSALAPGGALDSPPEQE